MFLDNYNEVFRIVFLCVFRFFNYFLYLYYNNDLGYRFKVLVGFCKVDYLYLEYGEDIKYRWGFIVIFNKYCSEDRYYKERFYY